MEAIEDELKDIGEDMLRLVDNLISQAAQPFKDAVEDLGVKLKFGPKNATFLWQPVDHHVGARSSPRRMTNSWSTSTTRTQTARFQWPSGASSSPSGLARRGTS